MKKTHRNPIPLGLSAALIAASPGHADFYQAPYGPGGTWRIYETQRPGLTMKDALAAAQASVDPVVGLVPGNLVSVTSVSKNTFLHRSVFKAGGDSWMGLIDREGAAPGAFESQGEPDNRAAGWAWTSGESYSFQNWGDGEPNDAGGREDAVHYRGDGKWNDGLSGYAADSPVVPTLKPGTSLEEVTGAPVFGFMVEYALDSPTPIPGIRYGSVFPPFQVVAPSMPPSTAGNWSLREVRGLTLAGHAFDAIDKAVAGSGSIFEAQVPILNFADPDTNGGGGPVLSAAPSPFLSNDFTGPAADDNNLLAIAKSRISIPVAGDYTIQVRSDDGFVLRIKGQPWVAMNGDGYIDPLDPTALVFERGTGDANTRGVVNLAAGEYDVEFVYWEGGGGAYFEVSSATGSRLTNESAQWVALGSTESVPELDALNSVRLNGDAEVRNQRLRNNAGGINVLPAMRYFIDNVNGTTAVKTLLQLGEGDMPNNNGGNDYITKVTGKITIDADANGNSTAGELIDVTFRVSCDDGASLRIIGQDFLSVNGGGDNGGARALIDNGGDMTLTGDFPTGNTNARGLIQLTEGQTYDFVSYMYEYGGGSNFNLFWQLGDHVASDLTAANGLGTSGVVALTGEPDSVNFPGQIGALVENTNIPNSQTGTFTAPFLPATRAILAEGIAQGTTINGTRNIAVLRGDGDAGGRPGNSIIASTAVFPIGTGHDNYLTRVNGEIEIDDQDGIPGETLTVTFGLFADDGADLHIIGQNFSDAYQGGTLQTIGADTWLVADFFGGNTNAIGVIDLVEGTYQFESHHYEGGGGSGQEIWWAEGFFTSYSAADFRPLNTSPGFFKPANTGIALVAAPDLDGDDDGIPTAWEAANGLDDGNAADAALDNDGDGQSNLAEYAAGTDPNDSTDWFRVTAFDKTPAQWQLTFPSRPGRYYSVQATTNVSTGPWIPVGEVLPPPAAQDQTMVVPSAVLNAAVPGPRAFFRVVAEVAP